VRPPRAEIDDPAWLPTLGQKWVESAVLHGWRPPASRESIEKHGLRIAFDAGSLLVPSVMFRGTVINALWPSDSTRPSYESGSEEEREEQRARATQAAKDAALEALRTTVGSHLDHETLTTEVNAAVAEQISIRRGEHAAWHLALALPQLFIAA
jgi:hypothetical protein